jgi:magnesium transporter
MERDVAAAPDAPWITLLEQARAGDGPGLQATLEDLSEPDRVRSFARLSPAERGEVLACLPSDLAARVLEQIPHVQGARALRTLAPAVAADLVRELASDERADILGRLHRSDVDAILAAADPDTAADARALLRFAPNTAGGLMVTEYVAVPEAATAEDVVATLRANAEVYSHHVAQYVYVVGNRGELVGVLRLRDLLLAPGGLPITAVMIRDPVSVRVDAALPELFELFDQNPYVGVPVVDAAGVLVGMLLREDVDEARVDRAEAAEMKARGIVGGEELRSAPVLLRSRRRLAWLTLNILLNLLGASVIAYFEDTLQAAIALAVFLPIISDMSGCSGNQAVAVSLREMSLGVTRPDDLARVLFKESVVGILNGIALGLMLGLLAWVWKGNAVLGLVVGLALGLNTLVAVCLGGSIPLLVRRLGFDPALASSPMLTTITDMCGFFLVLSMATLALSRLA